ncbi:MAG TPA: hypothetical protein VFJ09_03060 [Nocardioidaceae bacterium]|nr:hypothetical protein [Nocardioidaceae bacterium]
MTGARADRALNAVRRVREARERDSRYGLARALAERSRREGIAAQAAERLRTSAAVRDGHVADFLSQVGRGAWLAEDLAAARRSADQAATVAAEAGHRWQRDRAATRVVELLLERHAEHRRAEQARAEAREIDDIAGQGWLRSREVDQ